jgi:hypothetical protein
MKGFVRLLLPTVLGMLATVSHAETVVGDKVNCRLAARATAPVLRVLRRRQGVPVLSTSGAWSYVHPTALPACYVRSDLLASAASTAAPSSYRSATRGRAAPSSYRRNYGLYNSPQVAGSSRRRSSSRRSGSRSRSLYGGGGSCPCSGVNICVGPRGGRYCITSGGNKRYGV